LTANKTYRSFANQIQEIEDENDLKDYHAFVYWYIDTTAGRDRDAILNCICDGTHDKGIDAVLIDDVEKKVVIIQSKFERKKEARVQLDEADVKQFASVPEYFKNRRALKEATRKANPATLRLVNDAFEALHTKHYDLQLIFISTYRKPPHIDGLVYDTLGFERSQFSVFDHEDIMDLFQEKMRDWTPRLGVYNLPYKDGDKAVIRTTGHRSWILTVPLEEVRALVLKYPDKLFKKNVRDFLGNNRCNRGIRITLKSSPENFWYYNNGINILCDKASIDVENQYIRMENPQIVNGCQTARSIEKFDGELRGDVVVRVIEARTPEFVNALTLYQNSSNPVRKRDLKSNDPVQVRLKRELRQYSCYYEIKRGEEFIKMAKKYPAMKKQYSWAISNEDVAKTLASVRLQPHIAVSKGSEDFFDEHYDELFPQNISTTAVFSPYLLYELFIRESFRNVKTRYHMFRRPFIFKNRAGYYVLYFIVNSLREAFGNSWEKNLLKFYVNASDDTYYRFQRKLMKIASDYFEICYWAWRHAVRRFPRHETYFQTKGTLDEITKKHNAEIRSLSKQVIKLFERYVESS